MFRERKYRASLIPLVLFVLFVGVTVLVGFRLVGLRHEPLLSFGPEESKLIGLISLLAPAIWAIFPTYIGPDGLRATDGVGRFHDVRWEEIQSVSSFSGFLWVRRHGKLGKGLCFPKYLNDSFGFREYVRRNAPEGNPLRTFLLGR